MEEFFQENYTLITHSVEFLAAATGVIFYKKYHKTAAKFLIYFLVLAFFIDIFHSYPQFLKNFDKFYLIKNTLIEKNYWLSNIVWFISLVGFIFYLNYRITSKPQFKLVLKYCFIAYLILFISYAFFNFNLLFTKLNSYVATLSLWMVFVSSSIFYVEILQSDKLLQFHKSIYFYINSCVLLWNLVLVPLAFYDLYFNTADSNFIILRGHIFLFINVTFYLTLTLALIFCKPETK